MAGQQIKRSHTSAGPEGGPKAENHTEEEGLLPTSVQDLLCVLVEHQNPDSESLAELLSGRHSYATAWLILYLLKKKKVPLELHHLDISKCNLPSEELFKVLTFIPASVNALTLGPSAVKGNAVPLLRKFFQQETQDTSSEEAAPKDEKDCDAKEGDSRLSNSPFEKPSLEDLRFTRESFRMSAEEAREVFLSLPSSLKSLSLRAGKEEEVWSGFAEGVRAGTMASLKHMYVDIATNMVDGDDLSVFLPAFIERKPVLLETLSIKVLWWDGDGEERYRCPSLCKALREETFPFLNELRLQGDCLPPQFVKGLAEIISQKKLIHLQTLGLSRIEGNPENDARGRQEVSEASEMFAECLDSSSVPRLSFLDLMEMGFEEGGTETLLANLSSETGPPVEKLYMSLYGVSEEGARLICEGACPFLERLHVLRDAVRPFLQAAAGVSGPLPFESLSINVRGDEMLLCAELIKSGKGKCLDKLWLSEHCGDVLSACRSSELTNLRQLEIAVFEMSKDDLLVLSQSAEAGNFPSLEVLTLFFRRVGASGEWASVLKKAVLGGKLKSLKYTNFPNGHLADSPLVPADDPDDQDYTSFWLEAMSTGCLPDLRALHLSGDENDMRALAAALKVTSMSSLVRMHLQEIQMGGDGLTVFAEALKTSSLTRLETLEFGFVSGDWDGAALAAALNAQRLPSLRSLSLRGEQGCVSAFREHVAEGRRSVLNLSRHSSPESDNDSEEGGSEDSDEMGDESSADERPRRVFARLNPGYQDEELL
uniref:Uncharacterized protein n=1 Tax=Chromera velia CCMP2878 TaxID=1169474 RepID=A0A0G4G9Q1_9ALVE|eukprot:Cvel_4401.t1-p1 / transcript=Cvel_4401.t1 / gene=Cvel_4401 / organism=Chromera_velia_CCMP2878 / gene_product=hypothetical protein / transcript_product=hypothetical protein / location=Cvel_scaffold191:66686-71677(-) / protein_length=766 / sequence_SO=supercontig / SO=protein_coding / is_pseudo=false